MFKMPETIVCGDIGLVLLSGLGSRRTHPVGAEGAMMARRAPIPLSSIPVYIDQSMKLIVYDIVDLTYDIVTVGRQNPDAGHWQLEDDAGPTRPRSDRHGTGPGCQMP